MRGMVHEGVARFLGAILRLPGACYPWGFLFWLSLFVTVVALAVFRFSVSPFRVVRARNRALARLLEFRLYQHDVTAAPLILLRTIVATARYLGCWLPAIGILGALFWLLFPHVAELSEYRSFHPGEMVTARGVVRSVNDLDTARLEGVDGSLLEMVDEPFRSVADREIVWRFRARADGVVPLRWVVRGESADLPLIIGDQFTPLVRARWAVDQRGSDAVGWNEPLPVASRWTFIRIDYPPREWMVGPVRIPWILACFMLCMLIGLVLKPVFGVVF